LCTLGKVDPNASPTSRHELHVNRSRAPVVEKLSSNPQIDTDEFLRPQNRLRSRSKKLTGRLPGALPLIDPSLRKASHPATLVANDRLAANSLPHSNPHRRQHWLIHRTSGM